MPQLRLQDAHLDFALKHIEKFGDTDIFPVPFEFGIIRQHWNTLIKPDLLSRDVTTINTRPSRRILSPKPERGYRPSMQLDPLDCILYTALTHALGHDIEASRLPVTDKIGLSHRFAPSSDGDLWQHDSNWSAFIDRTRELARAASVTYILKADIADFFPHIYHHRLETRLRRATTETYYAETIMRMLGAWGGRVSYGLPIGPAASRLLAELLLDPIDRMLQEQGYKHCRWIDDIRIFCTSETEAKRAESQLVKTLYESYGLTLQYSKTAIVYKSSFLADAEPREVLIVTDENDEPVTDDALVEEVRELLNETGDVSLAPLDLNKLPVPLKNLLANYDLNRVLSFLLGFYDEIDIGVVRIVLEELARREDCSSALLVLDHLADLQQIISTVADYFMRGRSSIDGRARAEIGNRCLAEAKASVAAGQDFNAMWLLWLVAGTEEFDNQQVFAKQFEETASEVARRKLVLAMGQSGNGDWFLARRNDLTGMSPWIRRAFLYGSRAMLPDERKHWLKSITPQLDILERAIVK